MYQDKDFFKYLKDIVDKKVKKTKVTMTKNSWKTK